MMSSFMIPKVIGHRGARAYAPENTLASIHTAADLGITWVEIDIKLSKDGTAIVFHDEDLLRCTGHAGLVKDCDFAMLQELDAGSWFGDSFIGEKIPTLEQTLDVILTRNLGVNLEIKPCPGREVETAEVLLDVATRIWPEDVPPPLISSFQHVSLETAHNMMPDWPRGLLLETLIPSWKELAEYLDISTLNIDGANFTQAQIEDCLEIRKPLLAYTINDPEKARQLIAAGVDAVFSDVPDIIQEALEIKH